MPLPYAALWSFVKSSVLEYSKSQMSICADVLTADGIVTLNIFGNESNRSKSIEALQACFDSVAWLPEVDGGNVIVIAFKESPSIGFEDLYRRAQTIRKKTKLKSERWVEGLYEWMRGS